MSERPALLYLVHRIPFPPNKGDKIRSYHWLRFLAGRYRVHLGTFVDAPEDWQHAEHLEALCEDTCFVGLRPRVQRLLSTAALVRGEAMSVPYYRSRTMRGWVRRKLRDEGIERVVAFSSPMAQYVSGNGSRPVVDFVDVDSEKWRQYARGHHWPWSWLFAREGERLLEFEKATAASAAASVFVTPEEAALFRRRAGDDLGRVHAVVNGVDARFFTPEPGHPDPYPAGGPVAVFTGMMDYWANVDAVSWFAREVYPLVRERVEDARFYVVGARPDPAVQGLSALEGVTVTGRVEDVRPYLAHAHVSVAPLRVARGIQNKVLEALAMAVPVVATEAAVEGLKLPAELRLSVHDGERELAEQAAAYLELAPEARRARGAKGREWVLEHHDWQETLKPVEALIEGRARPRASGARAPASSAPRP